MAPVVRKVPAVRLDESAGLVTKPLATILAELALLDAQATPAPWAVSGPYSPGDMYGIEPAHPKTISILGVDGLEGPFADACDKSDAVFITAMRNALPEIVSKVDEMEALIFNLRACIEGAHEMDSEGVACRHCGKVLL